MGGCSDSSDLPLLDLNQAASREEIRLAISSQGKPQSWKFGFDLRNSPKEDARQYLPLLNYLERTTRLEFTLHFSPSAHQLIDDLTRGKIHFAVIGAGSYLVARHNRASIRPLVRGVNAKGDAGYRAVIVVLPGSALKNLRDLKGKRFVFGSRTSTQGYWIPRIMLYKAGLRLQDLGSYIFAGSHQGCVEKVMAALADACGMQDTLALRLIAAGRVRPLAISELYPSSGIFSHRSVPEDIRQKVRQALIDFDPRGKDKPGLYHWEATEMPKGFVAASEKDYRPLQIWAEKLHLLEPLLLPEDPK
ncbi:MAG: hypothetical protein AXA67_12505 [Methylothermaceae bacteria B42]|nr:MAG: hypothetical protein AXA67_12505 [Methylothermaceae bacteria B42]